VSRDVSLHLETARLLLPPLGRRHTADLAAIYADPDVARYIGGSRLDSAGTAEQLARFEQVWSEYGFGQTALLDRVTGRLLGRAGLHPWPAWDEVELGYVLAASAQGRGYATEAATAWIDTAFDVLDLERLTPNIHPDNRPSRVLAERLRFRVHRTDVTPGGAPVVVYERLASDRP
jgi:RimJ/RimL family protein N-acetyltransferase